MVKPEGTGMPRLVISARLAPLPPSRSFIPALPSAFPSPKKKTYLGIISSLFLSRVFIALRRKAFVRVFKPKGFDPALSLCDIPPFRFLYKVGRDLINVRIIL